MKRKTKKLKILNRIIIILILLLIVLISLTLLYVQNKLNKINYLDIDLDKVGITEGINEQLEGYRTIALLGIDSRADDYGKGNRSDCIILAILNEQTKELNLVSVYRDTYLKITNKNLDKVTHAYSYGGPELTLSTLNQNMDLNIKEFVTVNFEAVEDCIDALNGIELNITSEELKYINKNIGELNRVTNKSSKDVTTTGTQKLDGVQAVAYARIRYTSGGDYKRTERMRTVIIKMFEKAKKSSVSDLNKVADIVLPKIYTNIKSKEIISTIPNIATYKINENIGWPYNTKGATIKGVWYGPPITLESNVIKLHQEIYKQKDYEPSNMVKQISDDIISKTGYTNK